MKVNRLEQRKKWGNMTIEKLLLEYKKYNISTHYFKGCLYITVNAMRVKDFARLKRDIKRLKYVEKVSLKIESR